MHFSLDEKADAPSSDKFCSFISKLDYIPYNRILF